MASITAVTLMDIENKFQNTAWEEIYVADNPELTAWHAMRGTASAIASALSYIALAIIILIRTLLIFHQDQKWIRRYTIVVNCHCLSLISWVDQSYTHRLFIRFQVLSA
jgi:hypothetical protein